MQTRKMSFSELETMSESEMRGIMAGSGKPMPSGSMDNLFSPNPFWGSNYYNFYTFMQPNGCPAPSLSYGTTGSWTIAPPSIFSTLGITFGVNGATFESANRVAELMKSSTPELKSLGRAFGWGGLAIEIANSVFNLANGQATWNDALNIGIAGAAIFAGPEISVAMIAYQIYEKRLGH